MSGLPTEAKSPEGTRWGITWTSGAILLALISASIAVAALNQLEFTGDTMIYRERMEELFAGNLPYFEFRYEHFPLSIVPMALAWMLGGFLGPEVYTYVFAALMALCLVVTTALLQGVETETGIEGVTLRWLAVGGFLLPFVLFRSDLFSVVLAVAALGALALGREQSSLSWELAGAFAKGWPGLYAFPEWLRGRRLKASILAVSTAVIVALLVTTPGFIAARTFSGLHSESVVGAFLIALRTMGSEPLQLLYEAGATYVAVPTWAWILNLEIGLGVGLIVFARFRRTTEFVEIPRLMAATSLAVLLISPLLSPQFLIWVVPFVVFFPSRRVLTLAIAVNALTLVYFLGWNSDFAGTPWWIYVLNLRNLALIALAVLCAWGVGRVASGERGGEPAQPA
jgi:hypothetical protein